MAALVDITTVYVYDSAPSPCVRRDVQRLFSRLAPSMSLLFPSCPRQRRDSDDCGVFMALTFFAARWDFVPLRTDGPAIARLRELFASTVQRAMSPELFRREVIAITAPQALATLPPTEATTSDGLHERPARSLPATSAVVAGSGSDSVSSSSANVPVSSISLAVIKAPRRTAYPLSPLEQAINTARPSSNNIETIVIDDNSSVAEIPIAQSEFPVTFRNDQRVLAWFAHRQQEIISDPTENQLAPPRVALRSIPPSLASDPTFVAALRDVALAKVAGDADATKTNIVRDAFDCWQDGVLISMEVVDFALRRMPHHPDVNIIGCAELFHYSYTGRLWLPLTSWSPGAALVVCVAYLLRARHFVALACRDRHVEVRDSLTGPHPRQPSDELLAVIRRFAAFIEVKGFPTPISFSSEPCKLQLLNDCGIESVNNATLAITGSRGSFSRQDIYREAQARVTQRSTRLRRTACPAHNLIDPCAMCKDLQHVALKPQNRPIPVEQHQTEQPTTIMKSVPAAAPPTARPAAMKQKTPTLRPDQAPITRPDAHPSAPPPRRLLRNRVIALRACLHCGCQLESGDICVSCSAELLHRKPVPSSDTAAVNVSLPSAVNFPAPVRDASKPSVTCAKCRREPIGGISGASLCAWHHPRLRRTDQRCSAKNHNGTSCREHALQVTSSNGTEVKMTCRSCWYHITNDERQLLQRFMDDSSTDLPVPAAPSFTPLPHTIVRDHLAATRKGEWLFVEMHCRGSFPRAQCILRLRSIALPAGPAVADVVARFCGRCHEWHTSDVDGVPLPATDTSYFEVRRATPEEIATATTTTSAECDDSDAGSDDNDDTTNNDDNAALDEIVRNADRDPLLAAAPATSAVLRLKDALGGLHIIQGRPQHVHRAAWRAVAPETRAAHERMLRRLRDSPPEIQVMPLSRAVVEVILRMARERRWRDSTTSSQLAMARAALRNLMFHSLALRGHDVGDDRYFAEVQRSLQRLARISALRPLRSRPLTFLEFERLKRVAPHELTTLSWYLAGRVGDVRRLQPHNVDIAIDNVDQHGNVYVKATFTKGKGAHFWGPYSIHTRIPLADAKRIFEHVATARSNPQQGDLFSLVEQRDLSKAIGSLHDASLRSIRRGALTHFADCGASDRQIQQLSGHQSIATLQRYLDWGARSAEAKEAAQARADLAAQATTIHGGGGHPMWMGPHSGFATAHGKRVPSAPLLFPLKPATREALGLAPDPAEGDPSVWPLKAKRVRPIDPQTVLDVTEDEQLKAAFRHMMKFTSGGELLGVTWPPLVGPQLPKTSFSADDWKKLVTIGKAVPLRVVGSKATTVPLDGSVSRTFDIKSACKGFATPQHSKHERRPVFEPLTNATSSRIWVPYGHRSRQELRSTFSCCRFRWQFDFTSWFDQLELQNIEYFVCRGTPAMVDVNGSPESFEYFALTRPPQGGSWCSHLLSTLTWCIAEPLLKMPGIVVATQIDNVAIGGDDPQQFLSALRVFLQRCTHVGAQLNDMDTFPATDGEILRVADARNSLTFLGEVYKDDVVCNTVKNIEKITEAWTRLQRSIGVDSSPVTRRHIASLIGTLVWCAHTLNEPLRSHYTVLKTFSDISRGATSARGWDEAILITPRLVNTLAPLVGIVLRNSPAKASEFKRHAEDAIYNALQYDAIIVVDASATGAGALIFFPHTGEVVECRMGWRTHIAHSAWAEPIAAREAVRLARSWGAKTIAVVTDHAALAHGQRRPLSGNGAFSCAWHLNEFYRELYTVEGDHQVFYVEGCKNPADGPSRMTVVGDTRWHCRPLTDLVHPNLRDFFHPYALPSAKERDKAWWNL